MEEREREREREMEKRERKWALGVGSDRSQSQGPKTLRPTLKVCRTQSFFFLLLSYESAQYSISPVYIYI